MDKIAEYFNATPTQLFGTSKEIELEKSVLESNEYSDKVSEILKAVKYIYLRFLFLAVNPFMISSQILILTIKLSQKSASEYIINYYMLLFFQAQTFFLYKSYVTDL